MKSLKVIILTGPTGSGKTTLSKMLSKHSDITYISGDDIKNELFPEISNITDFPEKLEIVKENLFTEAKKIYDDGQSVIVDYVILGEEYIKKFQEGFGNNLILKIILPSLETILHRDTERTNWTSGEEIIKHLYRRYKELEPFLGKENYIDNSAETVSETFEKHIKSLAD